MKSVPAEKLGMLLSPLMNLILGGPLDRYQAIRAERVAAAMAAVAATWRKWLRNPS